MPGFNRLHEVLSRFPILAADEVDAGTGIETVVLSQRFFLQLASPVARGLRS